MYVMETNRKTALDDSPLTSPIIQGHLPQVYHFTNICLKILDTTESTRQLNLVG